MENLQELFYGDPQYYSSKYGVDIVLLDNHDVHHIQSIEQANEEMDALLSPNSLESAFICDADKDERLYALSRLIGDMRRNSDEHKSN